MSIVGQYLQLDIDSAAPASAPRLNMSAADVIAASDGNLRHAAIIRNMLNVTQTGGGVIAYDQVTGKPMVSKGSATALQIESVYGKPALAINVASAGLVGLSFAEGSLPENYTMVVPVVVGPTASATATVSGILNGFDINDTWVSQPLRYTGSPTDAFSARGADTGNTNIAAVARPVGNVWHIIVVDWNNRTGVVTIGLNTVDILVSATRPARRTPAATDRLQIGYHLNASSLKDNKIGDLYVFGESMLSSVGGTSTIRSLVAAIKTDYAIP